MKRKLTSLALVIVAVPMAIHDAQAEPASRATRNAVAVSPDNFNRAEIDMYFAGTIKLAGGIGKFEQHREIMPIDKQTVIRANRDTLYSAAVFDLDAGPATITMPDAGKRFMSMIVIDENQYAPAVHYGARVPTH